jgi:hypothetical protein
MLQQLGRMLHLNICLTSYCYIEERGFDYFGYNDHHNDMCSNPNDSYQNSKGLSNIAPRFIWVPIVATMYKNSSYFGRTIAFDFSCFSK